MGENVELLFLTKHRLLYIITLKNLYFQCLKLARFLSKLCIKGGCKCRCRRAPEVSCGDRQTLYSP